MCSISGVGERLHKVLGQIDLAHWTQVSDRCPLGYLLPYVNNKGADQPAHPRSLINAFVVHYLDSIIPILAKSEI